MAFADQATLAADATFIARVRIALLTASIAVMAEDNTAPHWQARKRYALACLQDPVGQAALMAQGVVTNGEIDDESSDGDIEYTVNSLFDAYAGSGLS